MAGNDNKKEKRKTQAIFALNSSIHYAKSKNIIMKIASENIIYP